MRIVSIALASVVAIGLLWSMAATSKLVPVASAEMKSAAKLPDRTVGWGKHASFGDHDAVPAGHYPNHHSKRGPVAPPMMAARSTISHRKIRDRNIMVSHWRCSEVTAITGPPQGDWAPSEHW